MLLALRAGYLPFYCLLSLLSSHCWSLNTLFLRTYVSSPCSLHPVPPNLLDLCNLRSCLILVTSLYRRMALLASLEPEVSSPYMLSLRIRLSSIHLICLSHGRWHWVWSANMHRIPAWLGAFLFGTRSLHVKSVQPAFLAGIESL